MVVWKHKPNTPKTFGEGSFLMFGMLNAKNLAFNTLNENALKELLWSIGPIELPNH